MSRLRIVRCIVALTASLVAGAPARAQERVSVTPFIGMYNPVGQLVADSTIEMLQLMTLMAGTRVFLPLTRHVGLEAAAGWTPAPSLVAQSDWQRTEDVPGKVVTASLRGRYHFNPTPAVGDWRLSVVSGFGFVHRYGEAWEGITGTTDATLLVGGGLLFGASTTRAAKSSLISRLSYGFDIEAHGSRAAFRNYMDQRSAARLHVDVITSFGLNLSL
jgi:hypothetical protein